jgi:CheY-like chemotaxis protein
MRPFPIFMGGCGVILVTEDNSDDAALLEQAFLQAGLSAPLRFVRDGQEAIEYLEGRPPFNDRTTYPLPNLLLVDLKMPRLDGFGLLDWLHHQPSTPRMLVGVLSGVDDPSAVERVYRLGAKFHIARPHRFEDLVSIAGFLIYASGAKSNEAAAFATTPEVLAAMRQSQTILPIHLRPSAP